MAKSNILDKRLIFVTGKGGVGKSDGGRGARHSPPPARASARSSARSPSRSAMSRFFDAQGVGYREVEIAAEPVRDLDRPPAGARGVPAAADQGEAGLRPAVQEPCLHLLRGRDAGPARAGDDRQGVGARAARSRRVKKRLEVRPRDRRRAGDRAWARACCGRPSTFGDIARVGPDQAAGRTRSTSSSPTRS